MTNYTGKCFSKEKEPALPYPLITHGCFHEDSRSTDRNPAVLLKYDVKIFSQAILLKETKNGNGEKKI